MDCSSFESVINLMSGQPDDEQLPSDVIAAASVQALKSPINRALSSPPLNYGDNINTFSHKIADFLMQHDNRVAVNPAFIVPTSGVSHALDILATMLSRPYRNRSKAFVFIEDATYYLSSDVFRDHALDLRTVAMDEEGISVDDLLRQLEELNPEGRQDDQSPWPVCLYMIPNFHNPTGRSISEARKRQVCEVAARFQLPVIADEVYNLLNYSSLVSGISPTCAVPTSMSALGYPTVISVSSFSKILAPGLRVGWIEFPSQEYTDQFHSLGFYCSGSNSSQFSSCVVLKTMEMIDETAGTSVLVAHINQLRAVYAERYTALVTSLLSYSEELLPAGKDNQLQIDGECNPNRPVGGYFLWVKIPDWSYVSRVAGGKDTINGPPFLLDLAKRKYKLLIRLGGECAAMSGLHVQYIRLCFAKLPVHDLREGARRLCLLLKEIHSLRLGVS